MLREGTSAHRTWIVKPAHSARAWGSGDVDALATPALVAFCEATARSLVDSELEGDQTTVGTWIEIQHVAGTPIGGRIEITATLRSIEGHRLRFEFKACDETELVAQGSHQRAIVDRARFETGLLTKSSSQR